MQCEEFEERLNAVLDERREPGWDAELRLHCETCGQCRDLAAAYGLLVEASRWPADLEAPPDMAARVLAELRPRPASWRASSIATAALVTAAGLMIAVLPLLGLRSPKLARLPAPTTVERLAAAPSDAPDPAASGQARSIGRAAAGRRDDPGGRGGGE